MKDFDQWTEELSKQIVIRNDEEDRSALWKTEEIFVDDDSEREK